MDPCAPPQARIFHRSAIHRNQPGISQGDVTGGRGSVLGVSDVEVSQACLQVLRRGLQLLRDARRARARRRGALYYVR